MDSLNYHHLLYFWNVVRHGSVTRAAEELGVAQPTISAQLRELERTLGGPLFLRQGRGLALTDAGRIAHRYADEIFQLGQEMRQVIAGRPSGLPITLRVGVDDSLAKLVVFHLLEPALALPDRIKIVAREGESEHLVGELATHGLDLVLSDHPHVPRAGIRAYNHPLGECDLVVVGRPGLSHGPFPQCLDGAPFLMPSERSVLRPGLEAWFRSAQINPVVTAEFDDFALLKMFGERGAGYFAVPAIILDDVRNRHGVEPLGRVDGLVERYFAISVERRLKHPAVMAITEAARRDLFTPQPRDDAPPQP